MSLKDFGGGYDPNDPDMNKEDRDNRDIAQWLIKHGNEVYWDRRKPYGNGTFDSGYERTPDLLVIGDYNTFAVEMKRSEIGGKVTDGAEQVEQYWRDIELGRADYSVNGDSVEIDAVLLATRNSPEGHLYHNETGKDPKKKKRGRKAREMVEKDHLPEIEHAGSEVLTRTMHRFARREYKNNDEVSAETGIGALYSSALDGDETGFGAKPAAMHIAPGAGERAQSWDYIPFHKQPGVDD